MPVDTRETVFAGAIHLGTFNREIMVICDFATGLSLWLYASRSSRKLPIEVYPLMITMLLGMHLMAASANLLMLFIALELVSVCAYGLTAFGSGQAASEAAIKYLLFGITASAFMLYGMSWLYGFSGSLYFEHESFSVALNNAPRFPVMLALAFTLAGMLFKVSAFPWHSWAPDVYESAPLPVVAVFNAGSKAAGLVLLFNFAIHVRVEGMRELLAGAAAISMIVGNLAAMRQKNPRRLIAWSSVAQSGFMLCLCAAAGPDSGTALQFYIFMYLLLTMAVFALLLAFEKHNPKGTIEDFAGLGISNPGLGICMLLVMAGLTGLPPTGGFTAKLLTFVDLLGNAQSSGNKTLYWLLLIAALNTLPALYYYLRIPFYMFFRKRKEGRLEQRFPLWLQVLAWGLTLIMMLGFFATGLFIAN